MATKNELKWQEKYNHTLYVNMFSIRHLACKLNVEYRGLLNWGKYNRKLINHGQIDPERQRLLAELGNMRDL